MATKKAKTKSYERYHIPNLTRALSILEILAKHPDGMTLGEISREAKFTKNSVFRIICTLQDCGYVRKDSDDRTIKISRKLVALGYSSLGEGNLVEKSIDLMRAVRDRVNETTMLGSLLEDECVLIEQVPSRQPFKFMGEIGMRFNLHASVPGKAIVAFLPKSEQDAIIKRIEFKRFNANTITDAESFRKELKLTKERGYALDLNEEIVGVHCVGAPVFDAHGYPIAAIWCTGPSERLKREDLDSVGEFIKQQAMIISNRLGYDLI